MKAITTTGRRKNSIARVRLVSPGKGNIIVNNKKMDDYFPVDINQIQIRKPLQLTDSDGRYDIHVNVNGGGTTGQTGAISLGISRALVELDEELKPKLKSAGLLTRDPRMVERKKYGQKKARKRFQFSKR